MAGRLKALNQVSSFPSAIACSVIFLKHLSDHIILYLNPVMASPTYREEPKLSKASHSVAPPFLVIPSQCNP